MSWNGQSMGIGSAAGLGSLSGDLSGGLQGNGNNGNGNGNGNGNAQPQATEYTLQGVMRFLQTEWHRHERERNAWEIEKQEMKGRIANLEGANRRGDATQKALKKYVAILEKKVKEQSALLKGGASAAASFDPNKDDLVAKIREKYEHKDIKPPNAEGVPADVGDDDESHRSELRAFLDQCQAEFTYLMVSPANPLPPRESPPLPIIDDLREDEFGLPPNQLVEQYNQQQQQQQAGPQGQAQLQAQVEAQRQQQAQNMRHVANTTPNHIGTAQSAASSGSYSAGRNAELQPAAMVRSNAGSGRLSQMSQDWAQQQQAQQTAGVGESADPSRTRLTGVLAATAAAAAAAAAAAGAGDEKKDELEFDAWDFNDGPSSTFPETSAPVQPTTNRPDTDAFPTAESVPKSPSGRGHHRRKSSLSRRRGSDQHELSQKGESGSGGSTANNSSNSGSFKLRFGLRGHLDTVRSVIFSGGGSPSEPEICTAGDDGLIKRFHIPRAAIYGGGGGAGSSSSTVVTTSDLDVQADFTHRGHHGAVLCLASWSPSPNFSTGGRAQGDGWIFSGGQDHFIRVWERGRVDPKASIDGHQDAVWALCVLPASLGAVFGPTNNSNQYGPPDRILLVSGAANGTVRVWAVSAPPQLASPSSQPLPAAAAASAAALSSGGRRGTGGGGGRVRGNSMSSGSSFPSSPQPTMASNSPFDYTLVHVINRADKSTASPTSIAPLGAAGEAFVVSYTDAAILVYDTRTGEAIGSMASLETYDGTIDTSVNAVVATTNAGLDPQQRLGMGVGIGIGIGAGSDDDAVLAAGPTGGGRSGSGVEGVVISGHEDRFIRFYDANSGQCTYNMLAHPAAISSLSLSPDGRELVSAGHDASLRFWSLEKRSCTQEITAHRIMRGEGVCAVVWSQDGRWVVSGGGDGVVKVFAR